jgi:MFS family permease
MGFVGSAEELVLLRAIQGLVTGTLSAANALVAALAPRERMGYAMGLLQVGVWSGVAIGPLIGGAIADAVGFRATFVLTSILLAVAGVVVWLGVEEKFASSQPGGTPGFMSAWRGILASPGVTLTYTIRFLSQTGRMMIIPIAPLFIQSLLPNSAQVSTLTGLVVGLSAAAGPASAIYLGRLGDRAGHRRVLTISALAAVLFYLPQTFVTDVWQLLILQALSGAAAGGIIPSVSALLARSHPARRRRGGLRAGQLDRGGGPGGCAADRRDACRVVWSARHLRRYGVRVPARRAAGRVAIAEGGSPAHGADGMTRSSVSLSSEHRRARGERKDSQGFLSAVSAISAVTKQNV